MLKASCARTMEPILSGIAALIGRVGFVSTRTLSSKGYASSGWRPMTANAAKTTTLPRKAPPGPPALKRLAGRPARLCEVSLIHHSFCLASSASLFSTAFARLGGQNVETGTCLL